MAGYFGPPAQEFAVGGLMSPSKDAETVFRRVGNLEKPDVSPIRGFDINSLIPESLPPFNESNDLDPDEEAKLFTRLEAPPTDPNQIFGELPPNAVPVPVPIPEEDSMKDLPNDGVVRLTGGVVNPDVQPVLEPSVFRTTPPASEPSVQPPKQLGEVRVVQTPSNIGTPQIGPQFTKTDLGNLIKEVKEINFTPDMLIWDGSCLGRYSNKRKIAKLDTTTEIGQYFYININGFTFFSRYQRMTTMIPLVIDEIKETFGLNKLGTHHIYFGKTIYRLIRQSTVDDIFEESIDLCYVNNVKQMQSYLITEIQRIFVFRHLVGVISSPEKAICLRRDEVGNLRAYSQVENQSTPMTPKPISKTCIKKWFTDFNTSPRNVFIETFGIDGANDNEIYSTIRSVCENVYRRFDPDNVHHARAIMTNCSNLVDMLE